MQTEEERASKGDCGVTEYSRQAQESQRDIPRWQEKTVESGRTRQWGQERACCLFAPKGFQWNARAEDKGEKVGEPVSAFLGCDLRDFPEQLGLLGVFTGQPQVPEEKCILAGGGVAVSSLPSSSRS